jgi:hypothetical protein
VQGAAGAGHHGPDAELGEHVSRRFHLSRPAYRVPDGALDDPIDHARVGAG